MSNQAGHEATVSEKAMAEDAFAHRHDPGEWAEEPADITVKPSGSEVVSVRVPSALFDHLEQAASEAGQTISQFVRDAIAFRLAGTSLWEPTLDRVGSSAQRLLVRHLYSESWTEGVRSTFEDVTVPDVPPTTVQGYIRSSSR
jgi:hypothetical protein